jgi:hypothetical protein
MRIRELLEGVLWSTVLGKLASLSTQFLPGRPRVPVPLPTEGIYRRADLEREFCEDPLPDHVLDLFEKAVEAHLAGYLQEALSGYFGLDFEEQDGSLFFLSDESSVVAYNVHLVYEDAGPDYMSESEYYLNLHQKLLDEAAG